MMRSLSAYLFTSLPVILIGLSLSVNGQTMNQLMPPAATAQNGSTDSLRYYADRIVQASEPNDRFRADSIFIRTLVRALRNRNSFFLTFDSLQTISKLYSPDSAFRIFTWQVKKDEFTYLQRGAIQLRTPDGSLKLIPLHDVSMFTGRPMDSVRGPSNWIGAIYYKIVLKTWNNKKYYTLLGFDDFNIASNKKWMEVMTFNDAREPVFGGPYFSFKNDSAKKSRYNPVRFNIEYKKEAVTTFNYDSTMDMIIYDQLVSDSDQPLRKESLVPDGEYEGFQWRDGQWLHISKVFTATLQDNQFPQEQKLYDDEGNPNEQKLREQTEKNRKKK